MFVAVNRFKIALGKEEGFERLWRERDSSLDKVEGFQGFHLLKGREKEDHILYAAHTTWDSEAAFRAWTKSDSFKEAHARAIAPEGTYLGHPELEVFEAII